MGLFDSVIVKCPNCGHENVFQSKSGPCVLRYVSLEDCPDDILANVNRHSPCKCDGCGIYYEVDIPTRSAVIVNNP